MMRLIPHSHQNLSCLKSGADYSKIIATRKEVNLYQPLKLNFEYG